MLLFEKPEMCLGASYLPTFGSVCMLAIYQPTYEKNGRKMKEGEGWRGKEQWEVGINQSKNGIPASKDKHFWPPWGQLVKLTCEHPQCCFCKMLPHCLQESPWQQCWALCKPDLGYIHPV